MTTIFRLLCEVCGLSQREAADFLDVPVNTVKKWWQGTRPANDGVLSELAGLAEKIDVAVTESLKVIDGQAGTPGQGIIELGVVSDDAEAQTLGWPCVGAHRAVIGQIVALGMAEGHKFEVVPRGSTVASAAAADAHGK